MTLALPVPGRTPGRAGLVAILLACGLAWGSTQSLGKIATATGHGPWGLLFWQLALGALAMGLLLAVRRTAPVVTGPALRFALLIALVGTLIPGTTFYLSVARLPAGIMAIVISAIPLIALPLAVAAGRDRFTPARVAGLLLGLAGVLVLAAPGAALPDRSQAPWLLVALVGPLFYAIESNLVAGLGTRGMDPVQTMFLVSLVGAVAMLPVALLSGQWVSLAHAWGPPEWAILAGAGVHAGTYAAYVWLAARAGAVFASQTSYVVTAAGLLWAALLLGERASPWVLLALLLMLGGVFLVSPRDPRPRNR